MSDGNLFTAVLRDCYQEIILDDLISFRGADASGSFSLQARHTAFLTVTEPGLSRMTCSTRDVFMAATEGLLEMEVGRLYFSTRRLFVDRHPELIERQLSVWLEEQMEGRKSSHVHLNRLESELIHHMNKARLE
ncbi:hypothetical protein [Hahella ganghwensis]|uniref:hypothetical protein n=1 Tax=Hahella ganghwensis TaxID=286420 RepID=UPI000374A3F5|nr:hypothetical protein [Hahella ganghwensis]